MQRITISLDDDTARALDAHVAQRGYGNRSEAVRDLVREAASRHEAGARGESCIGVLSYLFDHERRDLARKLVHTHHDHHAAQPLDPASPSRCQALPRGRRAAGQRCSSCARSPIRSAPSGACAWATFA